MFGPIPIPKTQGVGKICHAAVRITGAGRRAGLSRRFGFRLCFVHRPAVGGDPFVTRCVGWLASPLHAARSIDRAECCDRHDHPDPRSVLGFPFI